MMNIVILCKFKPRPRWEVETHKSQNGLEKENREPREFMFSSRCEKGEMMLLRRRRGQSVVTRYIGCKIL